MAEGDIGAVIDTGIFDAVRGFYSSVLHVSGDVFAVAYCGPDNDGWLCTFTIDSAGNIGAVIDTLEFDIDYGQSPWLIHISGDIFAIAYWQTTLDDGILKTVNIDSAGNIGAAPIDTLTFNAVRGRVPCIIHVSGDIYAIAYRGDGDDGWLGTVSIDNLGNIGAAFIDTLEFDDTYCSTPHIIHIAGNVFVIAYVGNGDWGHLKTVDIDGLGNIGAVLHSQSFIGAGSCSDPKIIHVAGDVYAIVYNNPSADILPGVLQTRTIDSAGNIGAGPLESYQFIPRGIRPYIIHTSGDVFALAARGGTLLADNFGWLKTIHIANDGNIGAIIDTLEFEDTGSVDYPRLIPVFRDVYAVVYSYGLPLGLGSIKTVDIETIITPTVTTDPATALSAIAATLNGTLVADGGEACLCGFEWGSTPAYGNTTPTQSRTTGQTFAQPIAGLDLNKAYHFRAFATNSAGTSYGSDRTFTTPTAQVQTLAATGVTEAQAQLNGMIVEDAGFPGDVSFEWGITAAYGQETPWLSGYGSGATFWALIYPLAPGVAYHFRARFRNRYGVVYGVDMAFATLSAQGIAVLIDDAALLRFLEVV